MSTKINSLTNCNVYLNGASLLGRCNEVTLPEVKVKMVDHKGLGMRGEIEIPAGGLEKMTAKFKWASYYEEVQRQAGHPSRARRIQVRGSLETYAAGGLSDEVPFVVTLGGVFKGNTMGALKQHESVQPESEMVVYYVRQEINGETLLEVDVMANIHKVAGEDVLARYRSIIGG